VKTFIAVVIGILFVSGCATGKRDLRESGELKVDVRHMEAIHIEEVSVYEVDGGLEVSGLVRRHRHSVPTRGTVEIKVMDPEGSVLAVDEAGYEVMGKVYSTRKSTGLRRHPEEGRFSKRLKFNPPRGSTVLLTIKSAELR
jgi:hypothetical protein